MTRESTTGVREAAELPLGLGLPLVGLVVLDLVWLRSGESSVVKSASAVVWVTAVVATPILCWRFWRRRLPGADSPRRWTAVAVLTAICSLGWYYLAFTIFVNIHLAMGGSL